jgi:1-acyl-sn-glycerol-3-phosphate acyltransferase
VGWQLYFHQIRVNGAENVPMSGGLLIVANHASFLDPTTVGWAVRRELHYLARKSLFKPPVMNWLLPICNVLPIDPDGADSSSLRKIIHMLKAGTPVLLFPEGTRTPDGTLQPSYPGAGFIAAKAEVPILPVRLYGTYESFSRHQKFPTFKPIQVVIGKPYLPDLEKKEGKGRVDKQAYGRVAAQMMEKIAELEKV